jgi:hypothetical protein
MEHLAQSLRSLLIESPMNGVWAIRASLQHLGKSLLVELMNSVAHCLRVTAKVAGDLVSVLSISAFEQDLATTQGEGLEGECKPASKDLCSASLKGRTYMGRFIV